MSRDLWTDPRSADACARVTDLAPPFVDGECPEAVASAVRAHLMDCPACRRVVQEETALRQWFVPTEEVAVPAGFAARVARAAFAGEGAADRDLVVPAGPGGAPRAGGGETGRLLSFTMALAAVAAAAVLLFTLILAGRGAGPVDADQLDAGPQLDQNLERIEAENQALQQGLPTTEAK